MATKPWTGFGEGNGSTGLLGAWFLRPGLSSVTALLEKSFVSGSPSNIKCLLSLVLQKYYNNRYYIILSDWVYSFG